MLKHRLLCLSLIVIATFNFLTAFAEQPMQGGWLWKISGNGLTQPSFLFGTYHGSSDILYEYVDSIPGFHQAFNSCSQYAGETIIPENLSSIMSELNIKMPQSTTYADLLNKEDYLFLDSIVNRHFKTDLKRMFLKPNYLSLFLGQMQEAEKLKKTGDSKAPINSTTSQVMDQILRVKAKEKGYTTTGLETISEQMNMLFPDTDLTKQASMLIKTLRRDSAYSEFTVLSETLPATYRSQKMENLVDFEVKADSLYQTSVELKEIGEHQREVLLKRRNVNWINKIPELIKDKSTFIAVGVRHLPGKNGLITLLREKGYKVEAWGM